MNNKAVVVVLLLITTGSAIADDWNLGITSTFASINTTDINVTGGGSSSIPAGAITGILPNKSLPLSAYNRSDTNVYSGNNSNISVTKQPNGSVAIDLVKSTGSTDTTGYSSTAKIAETVYQNQNTKIMMVVISMRVSTSSYTYFYTDASNPPTTDRLGGRIQNSGQSEMNTIVVFVQPQHYYKLSGNQAITVYNWEELILI